MDGSEHYGGGTRLAGPLEPVRAAVAREHAAIRGCVADAKRRLTGASVRAVVVMLATSVVWFSLGGRAAGAVRMMRQGRADPLAAAQFAGLAGATVIVWWLALRAMARARRRHRTAMRWTRGVPFDCPDCRYPLESAVQRCPECGWRARLAPRRAA
jgi:hypothetical protein